MINLRYHVVSLVAVFLALGLGVIMGSTVIDRVTVDQLRNQLDRVESSVKQTRKENGQLSGRLRVWDQFADQARDQVLRARLQTVPVLIVGVDGIDHGPVDDLRRQLVNAQATFQGTIWLSSKLRLGSQSDTAGLATALGVPAEQPDVLRRLAVTKIAAVDRNRPGSGSGARSSGMTAVMGRGRAAGAGLRDRRRSGPPWPPPGRQGPEHSRPDP